MTFNFNGKGGLKIELVYDTNIECGCERLTHLKKTGIFNAKNGEVYLSAFDGLALLGLGKKEEISLHSLRVAFFNLAKELVKQDVNEIEVNMPVYEGLCNQEVAKAVVEGMLQANYHNDFFKTKKEKRIDIKLNYNTEAPSEKHENIKKAVKELEDVLSAVFMVRELVNAPSNVMYPEVLAKRAKEELEPLGVSVKVYGLEEVRKMGLKAFEAVGSGSDKELRFIVMEYLNDPESEERLGLVGKGITYDTGGYSLKPSTSMDTMFDDMAGGATVIGAFKAIASQKLKVNVVGAVAACENALSGHSYKPGDVVGSLSGKTIEVNNTDAEGRVTLADSVYYTATELKATKLIDLATLTGACVVALGYEYTAAQTNNQEFLDGLMCAARKADEKIWQMPYDEAYRKLNNSKVADIKNTGGRYAGMITAGLFISEFNNNLPWIHLDIAGTAYLEAASGYLPFGGTGTHVKTLYYYAKAEKCCQR